MVADADRRSVGRAAAVNTQLSTRTLAPPGQTADSKASQCGPSGVRSRPDGPEGTLNRTPEGSIATLRDPRFCPAAPVRVDGVESWHGALRSDCSSPRATCRFGHGRRPMIRRRCTVTVAGEDRENHWR